MKLQRWDWGEDYMHECSYGDWCKSEDIAGLEAKYSELEDKCSELEDKFDDCAELVCAAKDVITRWDSPLWKMEEHTAEFINRLREAVAKCEGMP